MLLFYTYRWLDEFSLKIRFGESLCLTYGGLISVIFSMGTVPILPIIPSYLAFLLSRNTKINSLKNILGRFGFDLRLGRQLKSC
jgi:hypothetical protein